MTVTRCDRRVSSYTGSKKDDGFTQGGKRNVLEIWRNFLFYSPPPSPSRSWEVPENKEKKRVLWLPGSMQGAGGLSLGEDALEVLGAAAKASFG